MGSPERARPHSKCAIWPVCVLFLISRCHSAKSSRGSPALDGRPQLLGSLHGRLQGGLRAGFQSRPVQAQGRTRRGQRWGGRKGVQEPNKLGFRNAAPPFTSGLAVGQLQEHANPCKFSTRLSWHKECNVPTLLPAHGGRPRNDITCSKDLKDRGSKTCTRV